MGDFSTELHAKMEAVSISAPDVQAVDKKQYSAGVAKRLTGRIGAGPSPSLGNSMTVTASPAVLSAVPSEERLTHHHGHRGDGPGHHRFLARVADWLEHEREKRARRTARAVHHDHGRRPPEKEEHENGLEMVSSRPRAESIGSDSSDVSLDRLQGILEDGMAALGVGSLSKSPRLSRKSSRKFHRHGLSRRASSDTDFHDGDVLVPSCDVFLDNSKTLAQGLKTPLSGPSSTRKEEKEKLAWMAFKNEVIRLAHTLRLKGWRRVPLEGGANVTVERLSGALTNAVYVVSPPQDFSPAPGKKAPAKVLLRIYGPQVEHLIDRENELSVLRRLARKRIGPRLLGTFLNGRFEQYFNATTLTAANLREPETSKQIAKRMRELHDGVELLEEERDGGPGVWRNWDRWIDQVEKTMMYIDNKTLAGTLGAIRGPADSWKSVGLICGVEWPVFRAMVDKYRTFLDAHYGDPKVVREKLVFAHNDTQYGNILRVRPDDKKSPLLQPSNEHKQLMVIDFEYAAANLPGVELANHFSEWTYNYHNAAAPWICNAARYPTHEQQRRFAKAYVDHRPQFPQYPAFAASDYSLSSPVLAAQEYFPPQPTPPTASSASSIHEFMLDARAPPGGWKEEDVRREEESDARVAELLRETRLWRAANSALWVAWGIVQAKVPGLVEALAGAGCGNVAEKAGEDDDDDDEDEEEVDGFDYLAYAHDRALFFWGDCVLMGLVDKEDLPEGLKGKIKLVDH